MSNNYPNRVVIEPHEKDPILYYVLLSNISSSNTTRILCSNKINAIKLKNKIVELCDFVLKK